MIRGLISEKHGQDIQKKSRSPYSTVNHFTFPGKKYYGRKPMKKARMVIFGLLLASVLSFTSCETLARAFADQMGRNAADALWGKTGNN